MIKTQITLTIEDGYGDEFTANRLESWLNLFCKFRLYSGTVVYAYLDEIDNADEPTLVLRVADHKGGETGEVTRVPVADIREVIV